MLVVLVRVSRAGTSRVCFHELSQVVDRLKRFFTGSLRGSFVTQQCKARMLSSTTAPGAFKIHHAMCAGTSKMNFQLKRGVSVLACLCGLSWLNGELRTLYACCV